MKEISKAKSLFIELAENAWLCFEQLNRRYPKPGQYFESMCEERKAILRELKSDDLKDVRWPPYK